MFSRGNANPKHVDSGKVKQIGVRVKNLYKLEVGLSMHATIPLEVRWGDIEP